MDYKTSYQTVGIEHDKYLINLKQSFFFFFVLSLLFERETKLDWFQVDPNLIVIRERSISQLISI